VALLVLLCQDPLYRRRRRRRRRRDCFGSRLLARVITVFRGHNPLSHHNYCCSYYLATVVVLVDDFLLLLDREV